MLAHLEADMTACRDGDGFAGLGVVPDAGGELHGSEDAEVSQLHSALSREGEREFFEELVDDLVNVSLGESRGHGDAVDQGSLGGAHSSLQVGLQASDEFGEGLVGDTVESCVEGVYAQQRRSGALQEGVKGGADVPVEQGVALLLQGAGLGAKCDLGGDGGEELDEQLDGVTADAHTGGVLEEAPG